MIKKPFVCGGSIFYESAVHFSAFNRQLLLKPFLKQKQKAYFGEHPGVYPYTTNATPGSIIESLMSVGTILFFARSLAATTGSTNTRNATFKIVHSALLHRESSAI